MTTETTQLQSWLSRLFQTIGSWFSSKAEPVLHDVIVVADNVANAVKNSEASPTGLVHLLEIGIPMAVPASTGLVNAFKFALPQIVTDLDWASAETGKTLDQITVDGLTYLASKKGTDQYILEMNNFAAKVQKWFSDNLQLGLTLQQCLLTPQIVHNPLLLGIANEVIADINTAKQAADTVVAGTGSAISGNKQEQAIPNA